MMSAPLVTADAALVTADAVISTMRVDFCNCNFEDEASIKPRVVNQRDYHKECCSFCALGNSLRMANLVKWLKKSKELFLENEEKHVDIRYLIEKFKPPLNITILMTKVVAELEGKVKEEGSDETPFSFSGYEPVEMGSRDDSDTDWFEERFKKIEDHLKLNGAAVGCFYFRHDFRPHERKVYTGDLDYIVKDKRKMRHGVCIVGTADAWHKGRKKKAFLYLESDQPEKYTHDKSGFAFMLAKAMHRVYLLKV